MHHPTDRIAHNTAFVTPVVEYWVEWEIAQRVHPIKDWSDDPSHHERTFLAISVYRSHLMLYRHKTLNVSVYYQYLMLYWHKTCSMYQCVSPTPHVILIWNIECISVSPTPHVILIWNIECISVYHPHLMLYWYKHVECISVSPTPHGILPLYMFNVSMCITHTSSYTDIKYLMYQYITHTSCYTDKNIECINVSPLCHVILT